MLLVEKKNTEEIANNAVNFQNFERWEKIYDIININGPHLIRLATNYKKINFLWWKDSLASVSIFRINIITNTFWFSTFLSLNCQGNIVIPPRFADYEKSSFPTCLSSNPSGMLSILEFLIKINIFLEENDVLSVLF